MIYGFENFELDTLTVELSRKGEPVAIEPQVFALLLLLVENSDRLVAKDEIVEKVWDGRVISDAALSSRVKSLRAALGDDGRAQKFVRTIHGQGFRFVAPVRRKARPAGASNAGVSAEPAFSPSKIEKPSIAVLPLRLVGVASGYTSIADALPDELISELARLRWLFVIARGTAFRFRPPEQNVTEIGAALGVGYCLTGAIELTGDRLAVAVELAETARGGVVWGERFAARIDDVHDVRERIVREVVAALELHIPANEADAARMAAPDRLDAWAAYHLGLQHLYRFNKPDNAMALSLFERAVDLDPRFARAHAGLASSHFQNAFLRYDKSRDAAVASARRHGEKSVELDAFDPFANFALGRVHWLEGDIIGGGGWLDRAVTLSPNYAQGLYARAWANAISGAAPIGEDINLALTLSPLDPFKYAMLGVQAFELISNGDFAAAARRAEEAARAPGAHVLIGLIAVAANELNGDNGRAQFWARSVRARRPDISKTHFFEAFPFETPAVREILSHALAPHGF
jgi:TolB-like protein